MLPPGDQFTVFFGIHGNGYQLTLKPGHQNILPPVLDDVRINNFVLNGVKVQRRRSTTVF